MARHLIHIGYPKTGSTFLQHWFKFHPQLAYQPGRFGGSDDIYTFVASAFEEAERPWRITSSEAISVPNPHRGVPPGHRTDHQPWPKVGLAQRRACEMLADLFPNAYILIVTRGFRSMALSGYSQYVRIGGNYSLEDTLRRPYLGTFEWNYDELIRLYRAAFPDRVIVMPYELLAEDSDAFLRILAERMDIQHHEFRRERVNPSLSPVELRWYPRFARVVGAVAGHRTRLWRLYAHLVFNNKLCFPIRVANRLWPAPPLSEESVPDEKMRPLGALAKELVNDPLYARYRTDYQNPESPVAPAVGENEERERVRAS